MAEDIRKIRFADEHGGSIVSLELQVAMISYRAHVALERKLDGGELRENDRQALEMGVQVINTALYGGGVSNARKLGRYAPTPMQLYEDMCDFLEVDRQDFRGLKREILPLRDTVLNTYAGQEQSKGALQDGIKFFDELSEYALRKNMENECRKIEGRFDRSQAVA